MCVSGEMLEIINRMAKQEREGGGRKAKQNIVSFSGSV